MAATAHDEAAAIQLAAAAATTAAAAADDDARATATATIDAGRAALASADSVAAGVEVIGELTVSTGADVAAAFRIECPIVDRLTQRPRKRRRWMSTPCRCKRVRFAGPQACGDQVGVPKI